MCPLVAESADAAQNIYPKELGTRLAYLNKVELFSL
jgi:hypothetical protein